MGIYRVFAGSDGESHIEEISLEQHPELGALTNLSEVKVQQFDGTRNRDFNPLPERRLIIHLSGEVEIGTSDGSKQVFRAGDIRLMEDVSGRGHAHVDLIPSPVKYCMNQPWAVEPRLAGASPSRPAASARSCRSR